jgi:hypothetical protein
MSVACLVAKCGKAWCVRVIRGRSCQFEGHLFIEAHLVKKRSGVLLRSWSRWLLLLRQELVRQAFVLVQPQTKDFTEDEKDAEFINYNKQ